MTRRLLTLLATAALASSCSQAPQASGPLPHEIYVWQRIWTPAVTDALTRARPLAAGFVPLAAEVLWKASAPEIVRPKIDFAALKSTGRPLGLALRIGAFSGPFQSSGPAIDTLCKLARDILAEAAAAGIPASELQIDFDCADSRLAGYGTWVAAIKLAAAPVPISITALPIWLAQRDFSTVAREAGSFVLQVHSVEKPRVADPTPTLCDPAKADAWMRCAAKIGVPFRVALPTYSVRAAFDRAGNLAGLSAEGPGLAWPRDTPARIIRADARQLSVLVQAWTRERPANLTGILWYRLPLRSDTMNWRWPTLAAIIAGRTPHSALRVEATDANPTDIALINDGELDEPIPPTVVAEWKSARLVSSDALPGFTLDPGENSATFRLSAELDSARLSPGENRAIGWLRLDPPQRIHVTTHPH